MRVFWLGLWTLSLFAWHTPAQAQQDKAALCKTVTTRILNWQKSYKANCITYPRGLWRTSADRISRWCTRATTAVVKATAIVMQTTIQTCAQRVKQCRHIVGKLLTEQAKNKTLGCGFRHSIWHDKKDKHLKACLKPRGLAWHKDALLKARISIARCEEGRNACEAYANTVIRYQRQNQAMRCGRRGHFWGGTWQQHFQRCAVKAGATNFVRIHNSLKQLMAKAKVTLHRCKLKRIYCKAMATAQNLMNERNKVMNCGYRFKWWGADYGRTFSSCFRAPIPNTRSLPAQHRDKLKACKKKAEDTLSKLQAERDKLKTQLAKGLTKTGLKILNVSKVVKVTYQDGQYKIYVNGVEQKHVNALAALLQRAVDGLKAQLSRTKAQFERVRDKATALSQRIQDKMKPGVSAASAAVTAFDAAFKSYLTKAKEPLLLAATKQVKLPEGTTRYKWLELSPGQTGISALTFGPRHSFLAIQGGKAVQWDAQLWKWKPLPLSPMNAKKIAADGQHVWFTDKSNRLRRYRGTIQNNDLVLSNSTGMTPKAIDVAVGHTGQVYIIGTDGKVKHYNNNVWEVIDSPKGATSIEVGHDGLPWIRKPNNTVFRYTTQGKWVQAPGTIAGIGRSPDGDLFMVDSSSTPGLWYAQSGGWKQPYRWDIGKGKLVDVVGWRDKTPVVLTNTGKVFVYGAYAQAKRASVAFKPSTHGFKFGNSWSSRAVIDAIPLMTEKMADEVHRKYQSFIGKETYGLCGGMALAVHEHFAANRTIPANTQQPNPKAKLFRHLWERLLTTFGGSPTYANALRSIRWWADKKGKLTLPTKTIPHLARLTKALNTGRPVQMILAYETGRQGDAWNNHQVLAYRYESALGHTRIKVYDPNVPPHGDTAAWADKTYIHVVQRHDGKLHMQHYVSAGAPKPVYGFFVISPALRIPPKGL